MALHPEHLYDVVAINAASLSTQLSGLPFSGPIGGVRVALIKGQWVGFPTHPQLEEATFDMVVAGRVLEDGDVAIMMVEAESTPTHAAPARRREQRRGRAHRGDRGRGPGGGQAVHQGARARRSGRSPAPPPRSRASSRSSSTTSRTSTTRWPAEVTDELAQALTIAGKQEREAETDRVKALAAEKLGGPVRGPREGDQRRRSAR